MLLTVNYYKLIMFILLAFTKKLTCIDSQNYNTTKLKVQVKHKRTVND